MNSAPLDFGDKIDVYTTCPQSKDFAAKSYLSEVIKVAQWSDGCAGMLIYSDNSIVDPWLVAQIVLQHTKTLRPLVAVQPLYMHPYSVAKMVSSLGFMYQRQIVLNMIAGGFKNDLTALCDNASHDDRYARLIEYVQIIQMLSNDGIAQLTGNYYTVSGLRLSPPLPEHLRPTFLMSGSSPAGRQAALTIGATGIEYPQPPDKPPSVTWPEGYPHGIRIGIIARADDNEAWQFAEQRFPANRRGQLARAMATKISDSSWHKQLTEDEASPDRTSPYSLWPFNYNYTSCPYLIGSYEKVAAEIKRYIELGYSTFILDIPQDYTDVACASSVFRMALER